jgi:hypothetical protein
MKGRLQLKGKLRSIKTRFEGLPFLVKTRSVGNLCKASQRADLDPARDGTYALTIVVKITH